jgi:hypothetical protein
VFYGFSTDGVMGLFLVLFWCSAVTGDILRYNSRFDVFNSRLGRRKFPFPLLRELAGKGLIRLAVFVTRTHLLGKIEKIPGSMGMEWTPKVGQGKWGQFSRRRTGCPDRLESLAGS